MSTEFTPISGNVSLETPCVVERDEEPINAATHGFGCLLSICGTFYFAKYHADAAIANLLGSLIFAISLTVTYAASSLSHAVSTPRQKFLLRAWDQAVIYVLIVATYTPFLCKYIPNPGLTAILGLIWLAAFAGFISKVVFLHRVDDRFSPVTYIALGWLPALAVACYVPWGCLSWIALGGVVYTVGVFFLRFDRQVPYFHTVWHVCVIAASGCHFYAIHRFVLIS